MNVLKFFSPAPAGTPVADPEKIRKTYNRQRASVFVSATLGYGLYYVCRLSINVIKKPIVDAGILSESELGIIGTGLFVTYAVGKFANGFLADRSNVRRFLATGLLISALINLALGFTTAFGVYVALWAVNGWVQSMGARPVCGGSLPLVFGPQARHVLRSVVVEPQYRRSPYFYPYRLNSQSSGMAVGIQGGRRVGTCRMSHNRSFHA